MLKKTAKKEPARKMFGCWRGTSRRVVKWRWWRGGVCSHAFEAAHRQKKKRRRKGETQVGGRRFARVEKAGGGKSPNSV